MEHLEDSTKSNRQVKYRKSQTARGLVRYELQISKETKEQFEKIVKAVAEESTAPKDTRQRQAKARAQLFDKAIQGIKHEFQTLKNQIQILQAGIKALSPTLPTQGTAPDYQPKFIHDLPNDVTYLKRILTQLHSKHQQTKLDLAKYQQQAKQYQELYDMQCQYNEELKDQLKSLGITIKLT